MALTTAFQNKEDVSRYHDEWATRFAGHLASEELFKSESTRILIEQFMTSGYCEAAETFHCERHLLDDDTVLDLLENILNGQTVHRLTLREKFIDFLGNENHQGVNVSSSIRDVLATSPDVPPIASIDEGLAASDGACINTTFDAPMPYEYDTPCRRCKSNGYLCVESNERNSIACFPCSEDGFRCSLFMSENTCNTDGGRAILEEGSSASGLRKHVSSDNRSTEDTTIEEARKRHRQINELQEGILIMESQLDFLREENKRLMQYAEEIMSALQQRLRGEHYWRMELITSLREKLEGIRGARASDVPVPELILVDHKQLDIMDELKGSNGNMLEAIVRAKSKRSPVVIAGESDGRLKRKRSARKSSSSLHPTS